MGLTGDEDSGTGVLLSTMGLVATGETGELLATGVVYLDLCFLLEELEGATEGVGMMMDDGIALVDTGAIGLLSIEIGETGLITVGLITDGL